MSTENSRKPKMIDWVCVWFWSSTFFNMTSFWLLFISKILGGSISWLIVFLPLGILFILLFGFMMGMFLQEHLKTKNYD